MRSAVSTSVACTHSSASGSAALYAAPPGSCPRTAAWIAFTRRMAASARDRVPKTTSKLLVSVRRRRPNGSVAYVECSTTPAATTGCAACMSRAHEPPGQDDHLAIDPPRDAVGAEQPGRLVDGGAHPYAEAGHPARAAGLVEDRPEGEAGGRTGEEAGDVRRVRDATSLAGGAEAREHLERGPHPDRDDGRHRHDAAEEEDQDAVGREEDEVRAEHSGDRSRRAEGGDIRVDADEDLRDGGDQPGEDVEGEEQRRGRCGARRCRRRPTGTACCRRDGASPPCMNMLENSVSQIGFGPGSCGTSRVWPSIVTGCGVDQVDAIDDLVRDGAEAVCEVGTVLARSGSLEQEKDEDIQADDGQRDVRRPVAALVLVADREHRRKDRAGIAP